jgi:hypothetical protein
LLYIVLCDNSGNLVEFGAFVVFTRWTVGSISAYAAMKYAPSFSFSSNVS